MTKERVEARVQARMNEIDVEIGSRMEERGFMEAIRQANWFSEPLRTDALEVLFEQYKKIYG
jgi:hypothetical protein